MRNQPQYFNHKTHVSKTYSPIHVSYHISTFKESELFSCAHVLFELLRGLLALVVLTQLCMDIGFKSRTLNIIFKIALRK